MHYFKSTLFLLFLFYTNQNINGGNEFIDIKIITKHFNNHSKIDVSMSFLKFKSLLISYFPLSCNYGIYNGSWGKEIDYSDYIIKLKRKPKFFMNHEPPPYYPINPNSGYFLCLKYNTQDEFKIVIRALDTISNQGYKVIIKISSNSGIKKKKRENPTCEILKLREPFWED